MTLYRIRSLFTAPLLCFSLLARAQSPHQTPPHAGPAMPEPGGDAKQQLLAQLHDVINPQGISWWPLSAGWWVLLTLISLVVLGAVLWLIQRNRQLRYRRLALKMLEQINQKESHSANYAPQVAALLKRCFFAAYPHSRDLTAKIHGEQWAQLLEKTKGKPETKWNLNWSELLYSKRENTEANKQLQRFAKQWIKQHKALSVSEIQGILDSLKQTHSNRAGGKHVSV